MEKTYHPYHLVNFSPWPYLMGCAILTLTLGLVMYFHYNYLSLIIAGLIMTTTFFISWIRDVIRESTYQGFHSIIVVKGLKLGFILFIISEILFFVSFFWAFFHSSLSPAIEIGMKWPPVGVDPLNPFSIPLLNTAILLSSGLTVTWAHYSIIKGNKSQSTLALTLTCGLGLIFTALQGFEYIEAPFSISDSVYGSTFFVATGFHGIHVIIGTIFLIICLGRVLKDQFSNHHHIGFEMASWYWHFVDVVWLFLFICIYWWGSNGSQLHYR